MFAYLRCLHRLRVRVYCVEQRHSSLGWPVVRSRVFTVTLLRHCLLTRGSSIHWMMHGL